MRRGHGLIASALLLSGYVHPTDSQSLLARDHERTATAKAASMLSPRVDHHLHLVSPEFATMLEGPPLPAVEPPAELSALLRAREERWKDRARLAALYTDDAVVQIQREPKAGLFRGADVAAEFLSSRFAAPYRLTPVSFSSSGGVAHLAGYYSRGEGAQTKRIGYFHLGLVKLPDGRWRIKAEIPSFPSEPPQQAVSAEDTVAALDAAGFERGVVLSTAAAVGGRWVDIYRERGTPAERHRRVRAENDWTAEQVSRFPDRLIAFCSFNPLEPYALAELDRCAKSGRFRGLKLHLYESAVDLGDPAHVSKVRSVFAAADALRFPVVVHVGNNEGSAASVRKSVNTFLDEIVAAAPNIPIQIAHLWGGGGYSEAALAAYADAVSSGRSSARNLYFDVAEAPLVASQYGVRKNEILQNLAARMRQIGLERILFGSDAGGKGHLQPREAWAQFRSEVPLSEWELEMVARNVAPYLR